MWMPLKKITDEQKLDVEPIIAPPIDRCSGVKIMAMPQHPGNRHGRIDNRPQQAAVPLP